MTITSTKYLASHHSSYIKQNPCQICTLSSIINANFIPLTLFLFSWFFFVLFAHFSPFTFPFFCSAGVSTLLFFWLNLGISTPQAHQKVIVCYFWLWLVLYWQMLLNSVCETLHMATPNFLTQVCATFNFFKKYLTWNKCSDAFFFYVMSSGF